MMILFCYGFPVEFLIHFGSQRDIWERSGRFPLLLGLGGKQHLEIFISVIALVSLCRRLSALFLFA